MKNLYLIIFSIIVLSCSEELLNEEITMPSTPVLTVESRWGVVSSSYSTITDINDRHNRIIGTMRKGDIVEVLSKETEKESSSGIYWFEVHRGDIFGVVPEDQIDLYDSKAKALNASKQF